MDLAPLFIQAHVNIVYMRTQYKYIAYYTILASECCRYLINHPIYIIHIPDEKKMTRDFIAILSKALSCLMHGLLIVANFLCNFWVHVFVYGTLNPFLIEEKLSLLERKKSPKSRKNPFFFREIAKIRSE